MVYIWAIIVTYGFGSTSRGLLKHRNWDNGEVRIVKQRKLIFFYARVQNFQTEFVNDMGHSSPYENWIF